MTSFNFSYFLETLFPETVALEVRASAYEFHRDTVESTATNIRANECYKEDRMKSNDKNTLGVALARWSG